MELKENIKKAMWDVKVHKKSYRAAAKEHGLSYNMLYRHVNAQNDISNAGRKYLLNTEEQVTLRKYVVYCMERGYPRRPKDIIEAAHKILQRRLGDDAKKPGKKWLKKFLKTNRFTLRKTEHLTKSAACLTEENIVGWFRDVQEMLENQGNADILLDPSRIFNADETCVLLNPSSSSAIAQIGAKNVYEVRGRINKTETTSRNDNLFSTSRQRKRRSYSHVWFFGRR